ncbi:hypothetical protein [Halobacteriovorax sp.]|uniref:hypothetical protein n=1 Tax=Halobacteriovorax sp. TaxID=2020862 RepID=UPI003562CD17
MAKLDLENYVDAMLETSSVAAHDIAGQVHVMQFCVEELGEHTSVKGKKFLDRLESSIDELTDIISFYRVYLRKAALTGESLIPHQFLEKVLATSNITFWNEFKKIHFKTNAGNEEWKLSVPCAEVHSVVFSIIAIYLEELKKGQLVEFEVELGLKKLDSQYCQFTLSSNVAVDAKLFESIDIASSPGAKVLRKNLGHEILLSSELYEAKITSSNGSFEIILNMKVLDE